jgi:hypothetical protein
MFCVLQKARFLLLACAPGEVGPPVAFCWGFPCRHFLPVASEWITDGQKKTSWHSERTSLQRFVGKDL